MMQSNYTILNKRVVVSLICLYLVSVSSLMGGGVAAFKDQKFHSDSSATIIVYTDLITGSGPFVKIVSGTKETTIDRMKLAGNVEVPSSIPDNITNEGELKPLRQSLAEIREFSIKYPKSEPVLKSSIESLDKYVKQFESGQVRHNREWIESAKYADIQKEKEIQLEKARKADATWAVEMQRRRDEAQAFAVIQRSKGLELYGEQWLPKDEVVKLQRRDQENALVMKEINSKSVMGSVYSVFQVSGEGMLIEFHTGTIRQGGVNTSLAYLFGAAKGTAADGDYYKGNLYWCGNYSYTNMAQFQKTVNAYCLDLNDAIARVRATFYGSVNENDEGKAGESSTVSSNDLPEPLLGASATGSGFFVGKEGYFVTNAHVVEDAKSIIVLHEGKKLNADVIKVSKVADLAILKVGIKCTGLPILLNEVDPGQDAFALGFPQPSIQGLEIKITKGIISSAKGIEDDDTRFQIDTAVQPGNSGGPLCDKSGRLIGVVVARLNEIAVANRTGSIPQNVNYAIKASEVAAILRSKSISFESVTNDAGGDSAISGIKLASAATGLVIVRQ